MGIRKIITAGVLGTALFTTPLSAGASVIRAGDIWKISARENPLIPDSILAQGIPGRPATIQFQPAPDDFTIPDERVVMGFKGKSVLYLPRSVKMLLLESRTYEAPNFAEQIQEHYTYSYISYGLTFLILAATVLAK